jgi:hypothetical protein
MHANKVFAMSAGDIQSRSFAMGHFGADVAERPWSDPHWQRCCPQCGGDLYHLASVVTCRAGCMDRLDDDSALGFDAATHLAEVWS